MQIGVCACHIRFEISETVALVSESLAIGIYIVKQEHGTFVTIVYLANRKW